MLIDWFTVLAQIVNFLVLAALLKRFLYGRIIQAMDEREARIASRLEEANKKKEEAEREAEDYRQKNEWFDSRRDEMIAEAREEAQGKRRELIQAAKDEVEGMRVKWIDAIEEERDVFLQDLRKVMCREVFSTSQRALRDLADAKIEHRMVSIFSEKIQNLDFDRPEVFSKPLEQPGESVIVRSAFEISKGMREEIEDIVRKRFGDGANVDFEMAPDLICGIELDAFNHKVGWSIADYLQGLEQNVSEMIEAESKGMSPSRIPGGKKHEGGDGQ